MNYRPKLANDPRPANKPFYIKGTCPKCSSCLILAYNVLNPEAPEIDIFYDEWICPHCPEKICYLDWPEEDISFPDSIFGPKKISDCN
jgi:hypothetical protein